MNTIFCSQEIIRERQIRSISFCLLILAAVFLFSCKAKEDKQVESTTNMIVSRPVVLQDDIVLVPEKGLVYYESSPFTGIAVAHYENGNQSASIDYTLGKKDGTYKKWFEDGLLSFESLYANGKRNGATRTWWKDGKIRSEANYVSGVPEGIQTEWYKSGAKFKKSNLVAGKESGIQQSWRENGTLYNNYEAKNGRIFGLKRASLCFALEDEKIQI